jgi:hypothetical protein
MRCPTCRKSFDELGSWLDERTDTEYCSAECAYEAPPISFAVALRIDTADGKVFEYRKVAQDSSQGIRDLLLALDRYRLRGSHA